MPSGASTTGVCVYPRARTLSRAFSSVLMSCTTYGMPYCTSFRSTALQGWHPGWVNSSVMGWSGFMALLSGYRKGPPRGVRDGPFGGVSGGECSGLPVDTVLNQGQVVGFHFDSDRVEAFNECGLDGGA